MVEEKKAAKAAAKTAKKTKAEAAAEEAKKEPKTVEFHGLTLTFPPKVPLSLVLRYRQIQREAKNDEMMAMLGLLETFLGADQYESLIAKCDEEGLSIDDDMDALGDLVEDVMDAVGIGAGE